MATTGPPTSSMALTAASRGVMPSSIRRSTASTTMMASSTTRPMARTNPNRDSVLMENPRSGKTMKVPISETGHRQERNQRARQPCRKRKTTRITSSSAIPRVNTISCMPAVTAFVVSSGMSYFMPGGKVSESCCRRLVTAAAVCTAFDPAADRQPSCRRERCCSAPSDCRSACRVRFGPHPADVARSHRD